MTGKRRQAERWGRAAEDRAVWYLRAKGYRILEQRYKTPLGEIDIIASRRDLVVFVEVKARASMAAAAWSITPRQRARIARAAEIYLATLAPDADRGVRFDAVLVNGLKFTHMEDAWRPEA